MAYRDRSQGFGFVYVDLKQLLTQNKERSVEDHSPVEFTGSPKAVRVPAQPLTAHLKPQIGSPVEKLKEHLDRMQKLQHKLHAMLEELNRATDSKATKKH